MNLLKKDFIFQDVNKLDGVGQKLSKYLKKKKIEKVKDIILNLPYSETDRSNLIPLKKPELTQQELKKRILINIIKPLPKPISKNATQPMLEVSVIQIPYLVGLR